MRFGICLQPASKYYIAQQNGVFTRHVLTKMNENKVFPILHVMLYENEMCVLITTTSPVFYAPFDLFNPNGLMDRGEVKSDSIQSFLYVLLYSTKYHCQA